MAIFRVTVFRDLMQKYYSQEFDKKIMSKYVVKTNTSDEARSSAKILALADDPPRYENYVITTPQDISDCPNPILTPIPVRVLVVGKGDVGETPEYTNGNGGMGGQVVEQDILLTNNIHNIYVGNFSSFDEVYSFSGVQTDSGHISNISGVSKVYGKRGSPCVAITEGNFITTDIDLIGEIDNTNLITLPPAQRIISGFTDVIVLQSRNDYGGEYFNYVPRNEYDVSNDGLSLLKHQGEWSYNDGTYWVQSAPFIYPIIPVRNPASGNGAGIQYIIHGISQPYLNLPNCGYPLLPQDGIRKYFNIWDSQEGEPNTGNGGGGGIGLMLYDGFSGDYTKEEAYEKTRGKAGGSGVVIIRYQTALYPAFKGGTITYKNGFTIHTFTSSGTLTT
jgi:hypothetical protein